MVFNRKRKSAVKERKIKVRIEKKRKNVKQTQAIKQENVSGKRTGEEDPSLWAKAFLRKGTSLIDAQRAIWQFAFSRKIKHANLKFPGLLTGKAQRRKERADRAALRKSIAEGRDDLEMSDATGAAERQAAAATAPEGMQQ